MPPSQFDRPIKTYAETDILKDSDIWDYLQYLQINRINFLSTTIWDTDRGAKNQLLNLIGAVNQLEFLCWGKIRVKDIYKEKYLSLKPDIFKNMSEDTEEINRLMQKGPDSQLQLLIKITEWLKILDMWMSSMKRMRKAKFVSGVGELDRQPDL